MDLAQESSRKVIFVNGCPFSGKSYLISHLVEEFPDMFVVNFELFLRRPDPYKSFYGYVADMACCKKIVIAESVNNYVGWKTKAGHYDFSGCLHIGVSVPYSRHSSNVNEYASDFGLQLANHRLGSDDLRVARKNVKFPKGDVHIYDGENLEKTKEVVSRYVLDN